MSEHSAMRYEGPGKSRSLLENVRRIIQTKEQLNRRCELRYTVKEIVQYEFTGRKEPENLGVLLDVSRSGLRMTSPEPISEGTVVSVKNKAYEAMCEVRNCLATTDKSYEIGLKIVTFTPRFSEAPGEGPCLDSQP